MKRDMDLIRLTLIQTETQSSPEGLEAYDIEARKYHAALLVEAGYLKGSVSRGASGLAAVIVTGLSWEGHEFLDTIRNETVWNETKEKVEKVGGSVAISVVNSVAVAVAARILGI